LTDLDFYVDALISGRIHNVGPGSTPEEVEGALGGDFVDDARKRWMRRDFGLVEFHFNSVQSTWVCFGFSIQIHRLVKSGYDIVPAALRYRYGSFGISPRLGRLAEAVAAKRGGDLVLEEVSGEFARYHLHGTNSFVYARPLSPGDAFNSQELWSIEIRAT
jgi:hypothetical protein